MVGVDDEVTSWGSVTFQVFRGTEKVFQSGLLTPDSPIVNVSVRVAGGNTLQLVVTDGGNGNGYDHADWADARLTCTATTMTTSAPASTTTTKAPTTTSTTSTVITTTTAAPTAGHSITGIARYVAPSGNDDTGDGSVSRPWRTWAKGLASLKALGGGHTLVLRGGIYTEDFNSAANTPKGTASARARVTSYPGETVIIRGLTRLYDPDYVTFDHLVFESAAGDDPTQHMFRITNGIGWTVEANEFKNLRTFAGLHVTSWDNAARPAQALVRENTFHDQVDVRPAVNNNTQHFIYAGVGTSGGLTVTRNLFYKGENTGGAIKLGPGSPGKVELSYNTFWANAPSTLSFEGTVHNASIFRNIFSTAGISHLQLWNYSGNNNLLRDNVWWGQQFVTYGGTTSSAERDELIGAGNLNIDPRFTDAVTGDFRPLNSAAVGYGRYGR